MNNQISTISPRNLALQRKMPGKIPALNLFLFTDVRSKEENYLSSQTQAQDNKLTIENQLDHKLQSAQGGG